MKITFKKIVQKRVDNSWLNDNKLTTNQKKYTTHFIDGDSFTISQNDEQLFITKNEQCTKLTVNDEIALTECRLKIINIEIDSITDMPAFNTTDTLSPSTALPKWQKSALASLGYATMGANKNNVALLPPAKKNPLKVVSPPRSRLAKLFKK